MYNISITNNKLYMYKEIMYGVYTKYPKNRVARFTSKVLAKILNK